MIVGISACNNNNPYYFTNDYSDAPDFPDTTTAISKVIDEDGLAIYTLQEGHGDLEVTIRDNVYIYFTGFYRTTNRDDIFESSYVNGSTSASIVTGVGNYSTTKGEGFVRGILGMKVGERRALVVPDSLNVYGVPVYYDIEVASIEY